MNTSVVSMSTGQVRRELYHSADFIPDISESHHPVLSNVIALHHHSMVSWILSLIICWQIPVSAFAVLSCIPVVLRRSSAAADAFVQIRTALWRSARLDWLWESLQG